jgi:hypothetical protein
VTCWHTPVIPALGRLRHEDLQLEASLDYMVRPSLKKKKSALWVMPFCGEPRDRERSSWPPVVCLLSCHARSESEEVILQGHSVRPSDD